MDGVFAGKGTAFPVTGCKIFPGHVRVKSVIANQPRCSPASPHLHKGREVSLFSFRSFFFFLILFLFFCPPKCGMKENEVNKHFGRLLQPCPSWFMAWLGWRGKLPSPALHRSSHTEHVGTAQHHLVYNFLSKGFVQNDTAVTPIAEPLQEFSGGISK